MFPVLFQLGPFTLHSYGFFIGIGYLATLWLVRRLARTQGQDPSDYSDLCFVALVSGVVGARILFVATNWDHFSARPGEWLQFWTGGAVFYGGFLLAAALVVAFLRWRKMPLLQGLDVLAPGLALGHAIGRLGCFASGCCHGGYCPYPWGVRFHSDLVDPALRGLPLHPTQLYESAGLLALTGALLWLGRRRPARGSVALAYIGGYAAMRFVLEYFRGDGIRGFVPGTGLSTSQAIALGLFLLSGALFVRGLRRDH